MYSDLSLYLTKTIDKTTKKNQGIYFTPPKTIFNTLKYIEPYLHSFTNVLEPSCGSCEYITAIHKQCPHLNITGIEYNYNIFNTLQDIMNDKIKIINKDFLLYDESNKYDLIIGNPPFRVLKIQDVDKKYYEFFDGRPNLFIIFIIKSLSMLNDNGILSFILPKNFLNCIYYDQTRSYINTHFTILEIIECDCKYIDTQQSTINLIIQNKIPDTNENYVLNVHEYTIFGIPDNIKQLKTLYHNSKSLYKLNFKVSVGNIVWNQCKSILTNDSTKTRLIYSSDIVDNQLIFKKYKNKEKLNFIDKPGINKPLLVINRGYGTGNYNFHFCLINGNYNYLIENHLVCIKYTNTINDNELIELYNKIITSLNDDRTKLFIKLYFGNNAINTTELNYILPIYL
jgi:hypothetical protein